MENPKSEITPEKRRKYYETFKESNKDKLKEKVKCTRCGGSYTYYNASKHRKSMKCMLHNDIEQLKNKYGLK
jgi:hypothetical protein